MSERKVVNNFRATPEMIREAKRRRLIARRIKMIGAIMGVIVGVE